MIFRHKVDHASFSQKCDEMNRFPEMQRMRSCNTIPECNTVWFVRYIKTIQKQVTYSCFSELLETINLCKMQISPPPPKCCFLVSPDLLWYIPTQKICVLVLQECYFVQIYTCSASLTISGSGSGSLVLRYRLMLLCLKMNTT